MSLDIVRRCRFTPFGKGNGPTFSLTLWDPNRRDEHGKHILGYRLTMRELRKRPVVLFTGEDFHCAPGDAIDSDAAVEAIMSFLTLRPGDTDAEHFDGYTDAQRDYCGRWAETLSCDVQARFCDENGNVRKGA